MPAARQRTIPTRTRPRARWVVPFVLALAAAVASATAPVNSATSGTVVSAIIPSATNLALTGCPAASRALGSVLPGSSSTTPDCVVTFGSSNDTGKLRLFQTDRTGVAMSTWTAGATDSSWNAAPPGVREVTPASAYGYGGVTVAADGAVYKGARTTGSHLGVAKFTAAGPHDTGWNGDGYGTINIGSAAWMMDSTLDTQQRPIMIGDATFGTNGLAMGRLTTAGNPDLTFGGTDGWLWFDPDPATTWTVPKRVIANSDGSYWLSGCTSNAASAQCMRNNGERLFIAKVTADGVLDTTFGTNGILLHDPAGVSPGGSIVPTNEGGVLLISGDGNAVSMLKLRPGGAPDPTFGVNGVVAAAAIPGVVNPVPWGAAFLSDGTLLLQGDNSGTSLTWISRWTAGGVLDGTYDAGDGVVIHNLFGGSEFGDSGRLLPTGDGGAFYAGNYSAGAGSYPYVVLRVRPDGSLDPDFGGGDGHVEIVVANGESQGGGLAASDGRLYVGGGVNTIQVLRLGGDGSTIPDYAHPGTNFGSAGGAFGACLRTSAGAVPTWTPGPGLSCAGDGTHWNGIARTPSDAGAQIATATNTSTATATLQFGFRAGTTSLGNYRAPITFEVLAP